MDCLLATNPVAPRPKVLKGLLEAAPARRIKAEPPQLPEVPSGRTIKPAGLPQATSLRMAGSMRSTPTASTQERKLNIPLEATPGTHPRKLKNHSQLLAGATLELLLTRGK